MPFATEHLVGDLAADTEIYRIFPLYRTEQLFVEKEMALIRPSKWEDPCDNQLYQLKIIDKTTKQPVCIKGLRNSYYGLCWTLTDESDAMWRIYSPDATSVRVRTTIGKLRKVFVSSDDKFAALKFYIGKVDYLSMADFNKVFAGGGSCFSAITDTSGDPSVQSLLLKRDAFQHEHEVRMIYHEPESAIDHGIVWKFPIEPCALFDQLCFDSRLPQPCFETNAKKFADTYGFAGEITRSTLYDIPIPDVIEI